MNQENQFDYYEITQKTSCILPSGTSRGWKFSCHNVTALIIPSHIKHWNIVSSLNVDTWSYTLNRLMCKIHKLPKTIFFPSLLAQHQDTTNYLIYWNGCTKDRQFTLFATTAMNFTQSLCRPRWLNARTWHDFSVWLYLFDFLFVEFPTDIPKDTYENLIIVFRFGDMYGKPNSEAISLPLTQSISIIKTNRTMINALPLNCNDISSKHYIVDSLRDTQSYVKPIETKPGRGFSIRTEPYDASFRFYLFYK